MEYFRFISNSKGIYEAVDIDCPRNDLRRQLKPDGSWLPKVGEKFPGSISFWKPKGREMYMTSGLQEWHRSVLKNPLVIQSCEDVDGLIYEDELQIICSGNTSSKTLSWEEVPHSIYPKPISKKVVVYVIHPTDGSLLVMKHDEKFHDAGLQLPTGSIDAGESPLAAAERELFEESGLQISSLSLIDEYLMYKHWNHVYNYRYVFKAVAPVETPKAWTHVVTGHGEDERMNFHYSWMPLVDAEAQLNVSLGSSIRKI